MATAKAVKHAQEQFVREIRSGEGPLRGLKEKYRGSGIGPAGGGMGYALWVYVTKDTPCWELPRVYAGVPVRCKRQDYWAV